MDKTVRHQFLLYPRRFRHGKSLENIICFIEVRGEKIEHSGAEVSIPKRRYIEKNSLKSILTLNTITKKREISFDNCILFNRVIDYFLRCSQGGFKYNGRDFIRF